MITYHTYPYTHTIIYLLYIMNVYFLYLLITIPFFYTIIYSLLIIHEFIADLSRHHNSYQKSTTFFNTRSLRPHAEIEML